MRRIAPAVAALALIGLLAVCGSGLGSSRTTPLPQKTRVHTYKLDLDADSALERIQVYNVSQGEMASPTTYFAVADRRKGKLVQVQLVRVYGPSPGSSESGLASAWAGDLNGDGRIELAVRDFVTPSVGELLSIYRQKTTSSLQFGALQRVAGDRTVVKRIASAAAELRVTIKENHSPDGRAHNEVWRWDSAQARWACQDDCVPRG